jgi:hypothetical protein
VAELPVTVSPGPLSSQLADLRLIPSLAAIEKLSRRAVVPLLSTIDPALAENFSEIAAKPRPQRVRYSGITRIVAVPGIGPGIGEGDGAAP